MPYTLDQLEQFVSSAHYDSATAGLIARGVPALKTADGELISPGVRRIRGNLCNVHGRYGPCDKALSGKKKPGKGRAPAKTRLTPAQRAQARTQQRDQNASDVAKQMQDSDTGLAPAGSKALLAFAQGTQPDAAAGAGLAQMGLAEQAQDGSYRMTPTGRAVVSAMRAGDYQRAVDAVSRGSDASSARQGRATARTARQTAAQAKRTVAAAERSQRRADREAAQRAKKPAKASAGGSKQPEKAPAKRPARQRRRGTASGATSSSSGGAAPKPAKPVAPKPAKAPAKQIAPALQTAADQLSQGATISDADTQALIRNGLAKLNKEGELVLTAAGMRATTKSKGVTHGLAERARRSAAQRDSAGADLREGLRARNRRPQPPAAAGEAGRYARQGGTAQRIKGYEPGQLCPYCTADLALPDVGWYRCGSCGESFYAADTDSDYEDYHARRAENAVKFGAPAQPATMPTARVLKPPRSKDFSFKVFKDANGQPRWVAQSSTAFQDRDKEIVSTKALADDCRYADKTGSYGPLRWWHTPGLDLGDCDFNAMHGRVLIESGTFRSPVIAQKVAAAANGLEISLGFIHLPNEPDADGVFHHIRRFERSLVPRGKASNRFTAFRVKETYMFDPTKVAALKTLGFSDDDITSLQSQAEATEKAATDQGVAFKADEPAPPEEITIGGVVYAVKAFPPIVKDDGEGDIEVMAEEPIIEEEPVDDPNGLTLSAGDLAAISEAIQAAVATIMGGLDLEKKVASHVQGFLAPMQQAQTTKDAEAAQQRDQLNTLTAQVADLTGSAPAAAYRPSAAKDNVLTDATMLAAAKQLNDPNATDPWADIKEGLGISRVHQ